MPRDLNKSALGRVRFDSPPQLETSFTTIQPKNTDPNYEQFLFSGDATVLRYYPQK